MDKIKYVKMAGNYVSNNCKLIETGCMTFKHK